jgi:hypothetical protein
MANRSPKFILWRSKSTGRYCFKLCGGRGKPLVYSNQYRSKDSAVIGIKKTIDAARLLQVSGSPLFEDQC